MFVSPLNCWFVSYMQSLSDKHDLKASHSSGMTFFYLWYTTEYQKKILCFRQGFQKFHTYCKLPVLLNFETPG